MALRSSKPHGSGRVRKNINLDKYNIILHLSKFLGNFLILKASIDWEQDFPD